MRPMGYASALVNTPNQSAGEIVDEIVGEAYDILKGAAKFVGTSSKL